MTENVAVFILSTGRCGTQWIASSLTEVFSDLIQVEHEPLHNRYHPRESLAISRLPNASLKCTPEVAAHMEMIEEVLNRKPYIECGHPNWSTIPILVDRFKGQVGIIHLTRHPVPTCYSWLTQRAYQIPVLPHLEERILLSPFDPGVKFKEYQSSWEQLSPFEKCLYYWSEIQAFAMDLQSGLEVPWLRLRYEDIFEQDGLSQLLQFLALPHRKRIFSLKDEVVDKFRFLSPVWGDWQVIENHPQAMAIAEELGYGLSDFDESQLRQRYFPVAAADESPRESSPD